MVCYSLTNIQTIYLYVSNSIICNWFVGFLTAMKQEVTRSHKGWSLDSVTLHNDMTKMYKEDCNKPPAVCRLYIIYILSELIKSYQFHINFNEN